MIRITCTHCDAVLTIDDAFAGGVCRCQHCGTIQTVPSRLREKAPSSSGAVAQAHGAAKPPKTLYKTPPNADGLDALAEAVASSGLTSRRLKNRPASVADVPQAAPEPARRDRLMLLLGAAGLLILVLIGVVSWLAFVRPSRPTAGPETPAPQGQAPEGVAPVAQAPRPPKAVAPSRTVEPVPPPAAPPAKPLNPSFCGVKLDHPSIIYVLDRGDGSKATFSDVKEACFRSLDSLGSDRKYQVIFWNNGTETAYPTNSATYATGASIASCRRALEDVLRLRPDRCPQRPGEGDRPEPIGHHPRHRQRLGPG